MAEAQFIPGGGAGNIVGALNSGLGTSASMMERMQARRIRDQQARQQAEAQERERQKFEILAPAMRAKSAADVIEAQVSVQGLEQTETARASATAIIPQARAEFDEIMQLADPDIREHRGLEWIGRYGHLDNVSAYSKEFAGKKDVIGKIHQEATALRHLTQQIAGQKDVAKLRGEAAVEVAGTRAAAGDKISRYRAALDEARQANDPEAIELYSNLLQKAAASPINTALGSEQMQRKLEDARAAGDAEEISFWEKRINALTQRGVRKPTGLEDPRAKAWLDGLNGGAKPAAAAPAAAAPKPTTGAAPVADPFAKIKL